MRAAVIRTFGNPDVLSLEDAPVPSPGAGEVTIDVQFAGVGLVDALVRSGAFSFVELPVTPGIEVAGRIREVGSGVSTLRAGDRVAALLTDFTDGGMGGYAQIALAKAGLTIPLSEADEMATAAAVLVNGATAFLAMRSVVPDNAVAISGASGGLGQRLVAAAARAGAKVIVAVTTSTERKATLARLGATSVVSPEAFASDGREFDAAFDLVGGEHRLRLLGKLRTGGRLLLLGNASGSASDLPGDDIWLRSLKVEGLSTGGLSGIDPERIAAAATAAIVDARLRPPQFDTVALEQAAVAHRMLQGRSGPGKIVLQID